MSVSPTTYDMLLETVSRDPSQIAGSHG
jgi:hypothetical protein